MKIEGLVAAIDSGGAASADESQIAAFEALIGRRLPEDYRDFLGRSGGGHCALNFVKDEKEELIRTFTGLRNDDHYISLRSLVEKPDYALPEDTIVIGDDAGGNPIILSIREDRFGEIFLIDHEVCPFHGERRESLEANDASGIVFHLATNFSDYVAHLVPMPEDE